MKQLYRNGNYTGSSEGWAKLSKEVWIRDNYTCFKCKRPRAKFKPDEKLNTHHIQPLSKGGSDSKSNLMTICSTCHNKQHSHLRKHNHAKSARIAPTKLKRIC